jgi:hypothetical protein
MPKTPGEPVCFLALAAFRRGVDSMGNRLLSAAELRKRFDLYLTDAERLALEIKARAACLPTSTFLRRVALKKKIEQPPTEISRKQYAELARVGSNLNQIAAAINAGKAHGIDVDVIEELATQVRLLRLSLLGANGDEPAENGGHS